MYLYQPNRRRGGRGSSRRDAPTSGSQAQVPATYNSHGSLQKEDKTFGGKTFVVPVLPLDSADKSTKSTVLKQTVSAIRDGGGYENWAIKTQFLESRFMIESLSHTVKNKLTNFDVYNSQVWTYEFVRVINIQANNVNLPAGNGALTNAVQQDARYMEVYLTCRPRFAFPACTTLPAEESATFLLTLPRTGQVVNNTVTREMLRDPSLLVAHMTANNLPISFMTRSSQGATSASVFMKWKRTLYDHSRFEVAAHLLNDEYVGAGVISTPTSRLRSNMQVSRNPSTGEVQLKTVQVHYKSCLNIIAEMQDMPFEVNICEVVYNTLSETIKSHLNSTGYTIPSSDGVNNDTQLTNLRDLRDQAERQEETISQIGKIAQAQQVTRGGQQSAAAFLALDFGDQPSLYDLPPPPMNLPPVPLDLPQPPLPPQFPMEFQGQGFAAIPSQIPTFHVAPDYSLGVDSFLDCTEGIVCFISQAELAMRNASGTYAPIICWGCGEPHRFNECPMKDDPATKAKAKVKIDEWKANYVKRGYRTPNTSLPRDRYESDW